MMPVETSVEDLVGRAQAQIGRARVLDVGPDGAVVVTTPQEALDCFLRTHMDVLVMGSWWLERAAGQSRVPGTVAA